MKPFLETDWKNLLVASYKVTQEGCATLQKYLPAGTELDDFNGEHYVSIVAFQFQKTKILGVKAPFYRDFPEINLRFYVKRKVEGEWRRGVVFVRELVPCRFPALIANKVFRENFFVRQVRCQCDEKLRYQWPEGDTEQLMETEIPEQLHEPEKGTLIEHIIDHYWAYKKLDETTTGEFQVTRRPWLVHECPNARINVDIAQVYGPEWAKALEQTPRCIFYVDGSTVGVNRPTKLKFPLN